MILLYPYGPLLAWFGIATCAFMLAIRFRESSLDIVCGVMLVVGVLSIPHIAMNGHPVPPDLLARIQVGSTATDVESVLGLPTSKVHNPSGDTWTYSGFTWRFVRILFDAKGIVNDVYYDD